MKKHADGNSLPTQHLQAFLSVKFLAAKTCSATTTISSFLFRMFCTFCNFVLFLNERDLGLNFCEENLCDNFFLLSVKKSQKLEPGSDVAVQKGVGILRALFQ